MPHELTLGGSMVGGGYDQISQYSTLRYST